MPKVTGPLFSITARGTIGGALTYKGSTAGARVEGVPRPKDKRSANQVSWRGEFQNAASNWRAASNEIKAICVGRGEEQKITGYNYFVQQCLLGQCPGPTPPPPPVVEEVKFGICTDTHYADKAPRGDMIMRDADEKLATAVVGWEAWEPDFVVELGDYIDGRWQGDLQYAIPDLQHIETVYDNLTCPRYYVLGNHDCLGLYKADFFANTGATERWFSFNVNGRHFVVLDAEWLTDTVEMGWLSIDAEGHIPAAELAWLVDDLALTSRKTIVFVHQRLDLTGYYGIDNAAAVRAVLEASGKVLLVCQGHNHINAKSVINGIPYVEFEAMVENYYPENAWAKVVVSVDDTINITGVGKQSSYLPV